MSGAGGGACIRAMWESFLYCSAIYELLKKKVVIFPLARIADQTMVAVRFTSNFIIECQKEETCWRGGQPVY